MNNKLVLRNLYLMHKQSDQEYLEELERQRKQNEADVARGARVSASNQATEERFAREAQAAQARGTGSSPSYPGKGHVSTSNSGSRGDQYERAAAAAAADQERIARRKADQERINAANRQASEGQHGKSNSTGVDWGDPNSPSYKAWKKAYNEVYYAENKEYWDNRYRRAHPRSGSVNATAGTKYEGAAAAGRSAEVSAGGEAMRKKAAQKAGEQAVYDWARGEASRGMHGRTTQAQAALNAASRDTSVSTKYGLGARAKDLGRELVSSGKNYVSNYTDGARQIKDLWGAGAQSIANSGKKFLDKLVSKL